MKNHIHIPQKSMPKVAKQQLNYNIKEEVIEKDLKEVYTLLTKVYLGADMIEMLMVEIIEKLKKYGFYEFDIKRDANTIQRTARKIYAELTRKCDVDQSELFGEMSDTFKELFDKFIHDNYESNNM
jgi:hypothetical protein